MLTKDDMLRAIEELPENATVEDAIEQLGFLEMIERRMERADAGHTISHEDARRRMARWLK